MSYNNIDMTSAKNAINQCKNAINYSDSKAFVEGNGISKANWEADCNQKLTDAISSLISVRYSALESELDKCLEKINNMSNIQKLEDDSAYYASQISSKSYELQEAKKLEENYKKSSNIYFSPIAVENRRKIGRLESEIESLRASKAEIDDQIYEIKNA